MAADISMILEKYINLVLDKPRLVIVTVLIVAASLGWYSQDFRMDASADSLVVEGDAGPAGIRKAGEVVQISRS